MAKEDKQSNGESDEISFLRTVNFLIMNNVLSVINNSIFVFTGRLYLLKLLGNNSEWN